MTKAEAALLYASWGWHVLPVVPGGQGPSKPAWGQGRPRLPLGADGLPLIGAQAGHYDHTSVTRL